MLAFRLDRLEPSSTPLALGRLFGLETSPVTGDEVACLPVPVVNTKSGRADPTSGAVQRLPGGLSSERVEGEVKQRHLTLVGACLDGSMYQLAAERSTNRQAFYGESCTWPESSPPLICCTRESCISALENVIGLTVADCHDPASAG